MKWATYVLLAALVGCQATPNPVVVPPEIIEIPKYVPLPAECAVLPKVELPEGSSANDVMARQKKALDDALAQIKRCFDGV